MAGLKIKIAPSLKLIINTIIGLTLYSVITNAFFTDDKGTGLENYNAVDKLTNDYNLSFIYILVISVAVSFIIWLINRYGIFHALTLKNKQKNRMSFVDFSDIDEHITFAGIGAVCRKNILKSRDSSPANRISTKRTVHGMTTTLRHVSDSGQCNKNDNRIKKPLFSRRAFLVNSTAKNNIKNTVNKK